MENNDIKKMGGDEIFKRIQGIDRNLSLLLSSGNYNQDVLDQLRYMKNELIAELQERSYIREFVAKDSRKKKNLTNDPLADSEKNDDPDRFRK